MAEFLWGCFVGGSLVATAVLVMTLFVSAGRESRAEEEEALNQRMMGGSM